MEQICQRAIYICIYLSPVDRTIDRVQLPAPGRAHLQAPAKDYPPIIKSRVDAIGVDHRMAFNMFHVWIKQIWVRQR
jgi:hypothetical protein